MLGSGSPIPSGGGRVKLDFKGMGDLLRSSEIQSELRSRMARVQSAIPGSELRVYSGKRRARATVSYGSDYEEANTSRLSRALDLAGGQRGLRAKSYKPKARAR